MRAPVVADGEAGFSSALRNILPETKKQECSFYTVAYILNAFRKSLQPLGKRILVEVREAEDSCRALVVAPGFDADRPTWPMAADAPS
jgi:transposase-like protein